MYCDFFFKGIKPHWGKNRKEDNSHEILESKGKKSKVNLLSRPRASAPGPAEWDSGTTLCNIITPQGAEGMKAGAVCSSSYRTKVKTWFNFWSPSLPQYTCTLAKGGECA